MGLAIKFFKKSIQIADYIGFILPISQLNNTMTLYEFDLVKSIDLGLREYSNVKLHCCFNVYRRPKGKLNSKPKSKLESVKICRQDSKGYKNFDYDIRLCYWGDGTAGKILKDGENYSGEYKIKILNGFKDKVIDVIKNTDWRAEVGGIAMVRIKQYHIVNVLKREIKEIY